METKRVWRLLALTFPVFLLATSLGAAAQENTARALLDATQSGGRITGDSSASIKTGIDGDGASDRLADRDTDSDRDDFRERRADLRERTRDLRDDRDRFGDRFDRDRHDRDRDRDRFDRDRFDRDRFDRDRFDRHDRFRDRDFFDRDSFFERRSFIRHGGFFDDDFFDDDDDLDDTLLFLALAGNRNFDFDDDWFWFDDDWWDRSVWWDDDLFGWGRNRIDVDDLVTLLAITGRLGDDDLRVGCSDDERDLARALERLFDVDVDCDDAIDVAAEVLDELVRRAD